jgi:cytochrome b561
MVMLKNDAHRYGAISQSLHWLIACCLAGMLAMGFLMDEVSGELKPWLIGVHKSIGMTLLFLVMVRFVWRLLNVSPSAPETLSPLMQKAAHLAHYVLYGVMVAMPISGWLMSSAFGRSVDYFGWFTIPDMIAKDRYVGMVMKESHEWIAFAMIGLVLAHAGAALYHHYVYKDNVLARMLPSCCVKDRTV